jgi:pantoate--beta-alanine ligase
MEIIRTTGWMKQVAQLVRAEGRVTGLVPTMGALHEGHFSLVRAARAQCSPVVVSVFVNPKQFGPGEDFLKYPRAFESDCAALASLGVDYVFAPTPEEMYPDGFRTSVVVEALGDKLEGKSRPGHFRGVATVVLKLFELALPNFAYFGRKDAQQLRIIRRMAGDLNVGTEIVACPIVREADGLALSSRNAYLREDERRAATVLYRALNVARRRIETGERNAARLIDEVSRVVGREKLVMLDYAEIADADSFEPIVSLRRQCLLLVAALVGGTRLIDNSMIEEESGSFRVTI